MLRKRWVGVLTRLGNKLNYQQKVMIYRSVIEPHLNYCSSVLFLSYDSEVERLQKVQNKCMRNMLRMKRDTGSNLLLKATNFLSVRQTVIMNTMIFLFKIVNDLLPDYLNDRVVPKIVNVRKMTLRCKNDENDLETCKAKKACSQNSIFYKGINLYNGLPPNIKGEKSLENFKKLIKEYVRTNY